MMPRLRDWLIAAVIVAAVLLLGAPDQDQAIDQAITADLADAQQWANAEQQARHQP